MAKAGYNAAEAAMTTKACSLQLTGAGFKGMPQIRTSGRYEKSVKRPQDKTMRLKTFKERALSLK